MSHRELRLPFHAGTLLLAAALSSCAMGPKHSVMLGLTHVAYVEKGSEAPPVIFEAGMGDGLESWEPVFEQVAASTTVIAYSRPGYAGGFYRRESDGKRSADDVARTLKSVLEKTGTQPPYVLVGHSIGGPTCCASPISIQKTWRGSC